VKRSLLRRFAPLVLFAALLLTGCKQGTPVTEIKTLLDDPSHFDKQTVRVVGYVTKSAGIMGYGAYQVTDATGAIVVVTQQNGAPREGAKVGVEGEFRSAFTIGTETAAVIVESGRYTPPASK